jgi:two-component system, NtrC family, sensor kinase
MSKILIIDDEESNVRVLAMSLRMDDHEVLTAYSGEEGLAISRKEAPELVLTDIKMPGMDGIEVLKRIKAQTPDIEVIIITGHGDIDNAIEALKFGASDFINKPIRGEVLTVAIKRAEEKQHIRRQLKEYTDHLEFKVEEATREIRRQSNFLAKLIGSSNDGIIATDKELRVVIFNPGAERIFGYTGEEVVGNRAITDLLPEEVQAIFDPTRGAVLRYEQGWREVAILSKNGDRIPVRFYGSVLYQKQEMMGTVSFFQDLREIKRLQSELLRSERLAAIGQTVAGVAHGVKNILHGFKGGSYLVEIGIAKNDSDKLKKGWDMIQRNITRTSDLVLDLLSYSKERDPECEICDPNAIVKDVCEVMQDLAVRQHIEITVELDPRIGWVSIDPRTLHQCLTNLISNAIDACLFDDATDKQWLVFVRTQRTRQDEICFSVRDNGTGMSAEVKKKLFTSFFSTKGHRGTGLGLLVTRKLVEEHGGDIEVESQPGHGTTFIVRMPFCPPVARTEIESQDPAP